MLNPSTRLVSAMKAQANVDVASVTTSKIMDNMAMYSFLTIGLT